eukprot:TRINITY_DN804_c0_g1_i1.p1 TRINITY_DN804_c0_g1~~TRINITY_DN804_c0_g1_i1.p1  ORF type:complete len:861 (-),score=204.32 TRINITY_DN804_c0_g1_i1:153-2735(-)
MLLALLLLVRFFLCQAHLQPSHNLPGFLLAESESLQMDTGVALIGFQGDGNKAVWFPGDELFSSLYSSIKALRPHCMETGEPFSVEYEVMHAMVQNVRRKFLLEIETTLKANMRLARKTENSLIYDVDATKLEEVLQRVYDLEFNMVYNDNFEKTPRNISHEKNKEGPAVHRAPYVTMILNPDKNRIRPIDANGPDTANLPFVYRYRYEGSAPSQVWISRHRFVVVDISAGPCDYGISEAGEGSVSSFSVPQLSTRNGPVNTNPYFSRFLYLPEESAEEIKILEAYYKTGVQSDMNTTTSSGVRQIPTVEFQSQLSSVIVSALRHVFFSDIQFPSLDYAEKIIVPIIVLRNHELFNPFNIRPDDQAMFDVRIDVALLRSELKKLLLPQQEISIVTAVHSLSEHHHLFSAFFKSFRYDTVHTVGPDGLYRAKMVPYLDSQSLFVALKSSVDALTASLIQSSTPTTYSLLHQNSLADFSSLFAGTASSQGHRVLPVYVFSVAGLDEHLLLDQKSLYAASSNSILVLQTPQSKIEVPYFSDQGFIYLNGRASATKSILAGVAQSLGGLSLPYERFSPVHKSIVTNYLWAVGRHPFGPFSSSVHLSQIFVDTIVRNVIISRITVALRLIRDAVLQVEQFTNQYVRDENGEVIQYATGSSATSGSGSGSGNDEQKQPQKPQDDYYNPLNRNNEPTEKVASLSSPPPPPDSSSSSSSSSSSISPITSWRKKQLDPRAPLAASVVDRLHNDILKLEDQLQIFSMHFRHHEVEEAHRVAASISISASGFYMYVKDEIDRARLELKCCRKEILPSQELSWRFLSIVGIILVSIVVAVLFAVRHLWSLSLPSSISKRTILNTTTFGQDRY